MTKKDKIEYIFFSNPAKLSLSKIENYLKTKGFNFKEAKGSHKKLIHIETNKIYIFPVHGNETKDIYKKQFLKFYKYFNK